MFKQESGFGNVIRGVVLLGVVLAGGTLWFALIEGFALLDALYMTVITVSTVGFKEVHDLDASGQVFVLVLIICGLTVMTYTLGALGGVIIEGSIQRYLGRQRMLREIEKFRGHYIVCGHGRMGEILCEELHREGVPFVVIEGDQEMADHLAGKGYKVVLGDATEDEVLDQAQVRHAKGLVAVVSRNEDNLYITLSAREMCRRDNPGLYILSRATDQGACLKIKRAGADRVISPYVIGGMRLVQALLRPTVYDFVDLATKGGLDLMLEELRIGPGAGLDGVPIKDSGLRQTYDVIVIGIKDSAGKMTFNPGPDALLHAGDVLVAMGDKGQLVRLAADLT